MPPSRRCTYPVLAGLVVLVALLAGCTTVVSPGQPATSAGPLPALPAKFTGQQLSWGPCQSYARSPEVAQAFGDSRFDCAYLEVPLDYGAPEGRTAKIALLRAKATGGAGERIGSLLINPGGPGSPGTEFAALLARRLGDSSLTQRFDLVGFDPRGVGASEPAISCLTGPEQDEQRATVFADPSPQGVAAYEAYNEQYAQRCAERTGADVLANVGTRDVVRDLELMRQVLGDPKLTYYGFSYGTLIGARYAEAYGANIRAMVLDGAVDPSLDAVEWAVGQAAGFQQAFDAYAAWCATQPSCPLGNDPARATEVFQQLVRPLIDKPVPTTDPARTLSFNDAQIGVTQALYLRDYWPFLSLGISGLASGNGTILLTLADAYYRRGSDGQYTNLIQAFTAINCVDNDRITDPQRIAELNEGQDKAAPYRSTGLGVVNAKDPCVFWPVPPTSAPTRPKAEGLAPVVVVSVTGDPATPYQSGVDLARDLGGRLLSVEGNSHTAGLQGNACIDGALAAYLIDGTLPADGTRCALGA